MSCQPGLDLTFRKNQLCIPKAHTLDRGGPSYTHPCKSTKPRNKKSKSVSGIKGLTPVVGNIPHQVLSPQRGNSPACAATIFDLLSTQCYSCVMIPSFNADGNLPHGIHWATWDEVVDRFGGTPWRRQLLSGIRAALDELKRAGCLTVYLDGSFVSAKLVPGDFDGCWEEASVDLASLDPVLLKFDRGRASQKAKFGGELFPASDGADGEGKSFLDFFQTDKNTGSKKGIIALDLGGLT